MADGRWMRASNRELAAAVQAGDVAAERALVDRVARPLRLMMRVRRVPAVDQDDLLQETLIVLFRRLKQASLEEVEKLDAFVEAVAKNLWIADWRKSDRRGGLLDAHGEMTLPIATATPEAQLDSAQAQQLVREAVSQLKQPRDRELIREHYFNEVDKDALCAQFNVSAAHFDRVLYNARQRLRILISTALGRSS